MGIIAMFIMCLKDELADKRFWVISNIVYCKSFEVERFRGRRIKLS